MAYRTLVNGSLVLLLGLGINSKTLTAEEIRIPVGEQAKDQAPIQMPTKGMSKEQVKKWFGEPDEDMPAKGKPPISRWKYSEFTVYFDSDTVIHCVRNFHPNTSTNPNTSINSNVQ